MFRTELQDKDILKKYWRPAGDLSQLMNVDAMLKEGGRSNRLGETRERGRFGYVIDEKTLSWACAEKNSS